MHLNGTKNRNSNRNVLLPRVCLCVLFVCLFNLMFDFLLVCLFVCLFLGFFSFFSGEKRAG